MPSATEPLINMTTQTSNNQESKHLAVSEKSPEVDTACHTNVTSTNVRMTPMISPNHEPTVTIMQTSIDDSSLDDDSDVFAGNMYLSIKNRDEPVDETYNPGTWRKMAITVSFLVVFNSIMRPWIPNLLQV